MKRSILICLWVAQWFVSFTALNANWDYFGEHEVAIIYDARHAREDMVFDAVIAAVPVFGLTVAILVTGFFEDGFRWNVRPSSRFEPR